MEIKKLITSYNKTITANKKNEFIVIHYTANDGDTAKQNCQYFSRKLPKEKQASANYFVDENSIWQCVEDEYIAWHVGGASKYYSDCRNKNSIGIEMCSRINKKTGKYYIKPETLEKTKMLTAYLMIKYDITTDRVVRHFDVTRKVCPRPLVEDEEQWIRFKDDLKWVDDIIYLKENKRLTSAESWVLKNYEQDGLLKFIFMKWANDLRKLKK